MAPREGSSLRTFGLVGAALFAALGASCNGRIGDPPDGIDNRPECAVDAPLVVPMQRITSAQWREMIDELFGPGLVYEDGFPIPLKGYAYSSYSAANVVGGAEAKAILETAESVAMAAVDRVPACAGDETGCATTFLTDLARRALRRDASAEELAILMKLYTDARVDLAYGEAVGIAIATLLQMPQFLYALETKPASGADPTTLDGQEIAQRMALLYWNGLPDDALLAAAASGALADPAKRVEEARRMIADPRGKAAIGGFLREWLTVKDFRASVHDAALQDALEKELAFDLDAALASEDGLRQLLTSSHTKVNSVLETFYGLPATSAGPDDWKDVDLDPEVRVGILTHPLLLARLAHDISPSDILRGKFVRLNLMCGQINAPPAGAQDKQAQIAPPGATPRQQAEARLNDEVCGGCHKLMDPIGFGFSAFDGAGHYLGAGVADTKGHIGPPSDLEGDFDGVRDLGEKLAASPEVQACFATQWMRYAIGKTESTDEKCSVGLISAELAAAPPGSGAESAAMNDILAGLAGTPAFVLRASEVVK